MCEYGCVRFSKLIQLQFCCLLKCAVNLNANSIHLLNMQLLILIIIVIIIVIVKFIIVKSTEIHFEHLLL